MVRFSLAASAVALSLLAAAPAAHAQATNFTIYGPVRQHLPNSLRLVVGAPGYANTQVTADIPGISCNGRPARFKAQIDFNGAYANRVVLPLRPSIYRCVKKRLPKKGVVITPIISGLYQSGGAVTGTPIRLLP